MGSYVQTGGPQHLPSGSVGGDEVHRARAERGGLESGVSGYVF